MRDLDGICHRARIAAPVRLDERMGEAEQRRAAVLLPVGDVLQLIDRRRQRDEPEPLDKFEVMMMAWEILEHDQDV